MKGWLNDSLRWCIARCIKALGLALALRQRAAIRLFPLNQKRLRRRYGITPITPLLSFGTELEESIKRAAGRQRQQAVFASTSGSTAKPKRILYTKRRLRAVKLAFIDFYVRCCWSLKIQNTSLYVFGALSGPDNEGDSLTSLLLAEKGLPPYFSSLQAPYRVHQYAAIQALCSVYGATAVRLWIMTIANPGVLYSTNPSTLSLFLDEMTGDWGKSSHLIRDWTSRPETFVPSVHKIANRLHSRGSKARLDQIANSSLPLPLNVCAPACAVYVCWAGGYVKPFLDRIAHHLPPEQYRLIPMYSMSTETLATTAHFAGGKQSFLPLAGDVLYEFLAEGKPDEPGYLQTAAQLRPGRCYSMVVSDPYGLRRYQTDDLFFCRGSVSGVPDLHFMRRRSLEYSFTGEKLTAEQLTMAFQTLRQEYPGLDHGKFLTCIPSHPANDSVPHYKVLVVDSVGNSLPPVDNLAKRCDELIGAANTEYRNKYQSGRLGGVRVIRLSPADFLDRMSGPRARQNWEDQFKFLPLYRTTWESLTRP